MLLFSVGYGAMNSHSARPGLVETSANTLGALQMGKLSSALEEADTNAAWHDEFHSRMGDSFPNCPQRYDVARILFFNGLSQDESPH